MNKNQLITQTVEKLHRLPEEKVGEIAEFAEFLLKRHDEQLLRKGIEKMVSEFTL